MLGSVSVTLVIRAAYESKSRMHEKLELAVMFVSAAESEKKTKRDPNAIYKVRLTSRLALVQCVLTSMQIVC